MGCTFFLLVSFDFNTEKFLVVWVWGGLLLNLKLPFWDQNTHTIIYCSSQGIHCSRVSQVVPLYSLFWRPMQSIPIALLSLKLLKIVTG